MALPTRFLVTLSSAMAAGSVFRIDRTTSPFKTTSLTTDFPEHALAGNEWVHIQKENVRYT